MFAKDLSNKIFSPPRHQDTKFNYNNIYFLCLGAFVAILSGLSVLGVCRKVDAECGFFPRFTYHINAAIVGLYDGLDLTQPET